MTGGDETGRRPEGKLRPIGRVEQRELDPENAVLMTGPGEFFIVRLSVEEQQKLIDVVGGSMPLGWMARALRIDRPVDTRGARAVLELLDSLSEEDADKDESLKAYGTAIKPTK